MQKVTGARWNNEKGTIDQDSAWLKKAKIVSDFMYSYIIITFIATGCSHYFFPVLMFPCSLIFQAMARSQRKEFHLKVMLKDIMSNGSDHCRPATRELPLLSTHKHKMQEPN